jgi:hypothetical protein
MALLVCLTASVSADYRDTFRKAIQARNRGRWADVVRYLREAIAEQPRETGERINISGMDFVPYLPHYFLGLALFRGGDCSGALQAFAQSESDGTIRRTSQFDDLLGMRKKCEARLASAGGAAPKPAPGPLVADKPPAPTAKPAVPERPAGPDPKALGAAIQNTQSAIQRAEDAAREVERLESDTLLARVWNSEPALGAAALAARNTLGQARAGLDTGRRDANLSRLQDAASLASNAQQALEGVRRSAQTRRDELQRAATVTVPVTPVRPAGGTTPPPVPPPAAPSAATPPVAAPATRLAEDPRSAGTAPAAAPTARPFTPPPALAAAARLLFSARYQEAAASLGQQRYADPPAAAHAAMLRAAAYYSMYLVGGERDRKLLEQARQAATECRKLAPAMQADTRAFSPRFVEFYRAAR